MVSRAIGEIALMAANDIGDHAAHLRILDAAGLLHRGELILEPRPELAGNTALFLDQLRLAPFS